MSKPVFDEEAGPSRIDVMGSRRRKFLGLAFIAFLASCWLGLSSHDRRPYTCAVCRADRVDQSCFGLEWSRQQETDCSLWYASNVERTHSHSWVACTHCRRFGIPGLYGGYGCFIGGPITGLSRTRQLEIYQHFEDRLEAKRLFIRLGQMQDEPHLALNSLMEWVGEGYPGTWHDWWEKRRALVQE
jgi:hypothetical protein